MEASFKLKGRVFALKAGVISLRRWSITDLEATAALSPVHNLA